MRCQHVDDDTQCRMDATRHVLVGGGDPPDPDRAGLARTVYLVQVCKEHDPDPRRSMPLPRPLVPLPIGERPGWWGYGPGFKSRAFCVSYSAQ
jgi:hypothetical protein